jgi:hypothetical protein
MGEGLRTKIYTSVSQIPVVDWEQVYPQAIEGYAFFKTLEESGLSQFSFLYCLVYDGAKVVGIAPFFLMDFHIDMAVQGVLRKVSKAIKRIAPGIMSMKTLFCGLPMGQGRVGLKGDKELVLGSICECLEEVARQRKASILVFKDFNDSSVPDLELLLRRGFLRSQSLPSAAMNITFDSFEGYLKTLSGSSREGFRRKFKKMDKENPEISMEVHTTVDEDVARQAHALYLQTALQSDVEFEVLPPEFFINASKNLPDQARFFLWRTPDKKMIAFAFCLVKADYFVDYYLGFDYSVAHTYNLYLVRFRGLLEWCIANKMKTYEIGQSSYEIKRRLGFKFMPLSIYTKPCSRLIAPFFRFHNKFLMFERFDPVFKQMRQEGAVFEPAQR